MTMEKWVILFIYLLILVLAVIRFSEKEKGKVIRRFKVAKAMTIGTRQVQEDNYGICQSSEGFLAVLADGMGKNYGGKVSVRTAVDTMKEMFADYQAAKNPAYFFQKAFHQVNREILNELDDGRGETSLSAVLIKDNFLYYAVVAGNAKIDALVSLAYAMGNDWASEKNRQF